MWIRRCRKTILILPLSLFIKEAFLIKTSEYKVIILVYFLRDLEYYPKNIQARYIDHESPDTMSFLYISSLQFYNF